MSQDLAAADCKCSHIILNPKCQQQQANPHLSQRSPVIYRAPPRGAHICPQLFHAAVCRAWIYRFMSHRLHRVADPGLLLFSRQRCQVLLGKMESPTPNVIFTVEQTRCPLRPKILIIVFVRIFLFYAQLGEVWPCCLSPL